MVLSQIEEYKKPSAVFPSAPGDSIPVSDCMRQKIETSVAFSGSAMTAGASEVGGSVTLAKGSWLRGRALEAKLIPAKQQQPS